MEPTSEQIKAMQDADQARLVLENPLVVHALDAIEREVIGLWADLPIDKKAEAEEAKRLLFAMRQFKGLFVKLVEGGEIARYELIEASNQQARWEENRKKVYGY